jgi:hypothetical protein
MSGAPKRKFKNLDEVLQNESVHGKHVTYHVPPGNYVIDIPRYLPCCVFFSRVKIWW